LLFAFTLVLALGIAVSQPALPSLVQAWFPSHLGRATAVFSNGLLAGEVLAATITLPLLLGGLRLGWQGSLAFWALPAGATLALWIVLTPGGGGPSATARPARWLPDLGSGSAWRVALLMAGASVTYFGMNTWIPDTLAARRGSALIPAALGLLNFMQIPVSLALTLAGDRLIGRRWPYVVAGLGCSLGIAGFGFGPVAASPGFAGLIGAGSSLVFVLNLALPALLAPAEVARVSGFMFMVGYGCAFLIPAAGGLAWDRTGDPLAALLPIGVSALLIVGLGASLPRLRRAGSPSACPEPSPPA
jgi:CP family cyanate transporter-like MFS transporter